MFKIAIITIILLIMQSAIAIKCPSEVHPVYCTILKINKHTKDAMKISNIIVKYSKHYKIDKYIVVAILAQESMFEVNSIGWKKVSEDKEIIPPKNFKYLMDKGEYRKVITITKEYKGIDFGMSQINITNIDYYKMDRERLLNDMDYSIEMCAFILSKILKYRKKDNNWWTRYTSFKNRFRNRYYKKVCRWYHGSKYCGNNEKTI